MNEAPVNVTLVAGMGEGYHFPTKKKFDTAIKIIKNYLSYLFGTKVNK